MDSHEVLQHLDRIAGLTPTATRETLASLLKDKTFAKVVWYTLNPYLTFGVGKLPEPDGNITPGNFTDDTWRLLDALSARQLTGHSARDGLVQEMTWLNEESISLLQRIITGDLRCGVTAKTVNKVVPGTIPTFECQLAHRYEERHIKKWPVAVEPKYDGVRALLVLQKRQSKFVTRTGKVLEAVQWLADEIHELWWAGNVGGLWWKTEDGPVEVVLDGEIVSRTGDFYKVMQVRGKTRCEGVNFHVFDMTGLGQFIAGGDLAEYRTRRWGLERVVWPTIFRHHEHCRLTPSYHAQDHDEVMSLYDLVRQDGGEGVIVKPYGGDYACKRSRNWLKIKDQLTVDAPIVGVVPGTGKYEGMVGAIKLDVDGVIVRVGSGLTDAQRGGDIVIGRMVEVEYHEKTPDGSLRHPRFVRYRDDKPVEDGLGV